MELDGSLLRLGLARLRDGRGFLGVLDGGSHD